MGTLLTDRQNEVLIEYRQFAIGMVTDIRELSFDSNSEKWIRYKNDQLYFQSARSDHHADVRMQHWSAEPPVPQDRNWEVSSKFEFFSANNVLAVWTLTMGPADLQIDLNSGWYNMRAYCHGRTAIVRTNWDYDSGKGFPRSIERYLLQVWATG
ncbi:hypothetical protein [Actinomadura litoris]|uniref:hypothetical protein n=1 Tax=Actinomadura litoris TaxID=2678616 RepID=UPI001FA8048F|nr:hypothetical protein [Actinomadura litoris]